MSISAWRPASIVWRVFWLALFVLSALFLLHTAADAHSATANEIAPMDTQTLPGSWRGDCTDALGVPCKVPTPFGEGAEGAGVDGGIPRNELMLTVINPQGAKGVVTIQPSGIRCLGGCIHSVAVGTPLSLEWTVEDSHTVFLGWSGDCSGMATTCGPFAMTTDKTVMATFGVISTTLTVTVSSATGTSGSVTSSPAGIDCPGLCSAEFPYSSTVTLTATPGDAESALAEWTGDCAGEPSSVCVVKNSGEDTIGATFGKAKEKVRVDVSNTAGSKGRVKSTPEGIDCSNGVCEADFAHGVEITLKATAENTRTVFAGWSGACAGVSGAVCVVTPEGDVDVGAEFKEAESRSYLPAILR